MDAATLCDRAPAMRKDDVRALTETKCGQMPEKKLATGLCER